MGKYARMVTDLPGPKSKKLIEKKEQYVANAFSLHLPAIIDKAQGALFTDIDGNTFIDFAGGVGVLNAGHCPPDVVKAVQEQVARFIHTDFSVVPYQSLIELAERLAKLAPGPTPKKCGFFNCGAEAVENSVKIAKKATGRKGIITFECAFHGRTLMAMTLTSKVKPYKEGFGPFASDVYRIPFAYCYRCSYGLKYPSCGLHCVEALERFFVTTVKSIAAGLPLSGVIGKQKIMDAPEDSTIGGTYVGNPVACTAALKVLDIFEKEHLLDRSKAIGAKLMAAFQELQERYKVVGDVRGLGAMVAIELVKDPVTKEPNPEFVTKVIKAAMKRGLLLLKAGVQGNCIRCLTPLVITDDQLDEAIGIIKEAFAEAS